MMEQKQKILLVAASILCMVLFYVIAWQGPVQIKALHRADNAATLNVLAGVGEDKSLDFYVGRIEDRVFGPVKQALSGLALMIIGLLFLQEAGTIPFIGSICVYLILTRPQVLLYPPYGDAIGGPFAEALWLAHNSFDYLSLAKQPIYILGGPKVYLFSIYPTYLAVLIKCVTHIKTFLVINHTLVFLFSAITIAYFRKSMRLVTDSKTALLVSLTLLFLPLFQSQSEAINMEMPLVMFSVIAAYHLIRKNILLASFMAILAAMVKGVGIVMCATVFFIGLCLFFLGDKQERFKVKTLMWSSLTIIFLVVKSYASLFVLNEKGNVDMVGAFQGWASLVLNPTTYMYLASLAVLVGVFAVYIFRKRTVQLFLKEHYAACVMFCCAGAWFGLFLHSFAVSPRYRLLLTPFLVFCVFFVFHVMVKNKILLQRALIAGIIVASFCSYGVLYPSQRGGRHVVLERSLEYRNDLLLAMKVARILEDRFNGFTIGAPHIFAQMFVFPELGYVSKKHDVLMYGMRCTYGGVKNFEGLTPEILRRTIWVATPSERYDTMAYPISPQDKVVDVLAMGDKEAYLFVGGFGIESVWRRAMAARQYRLRMLEEEKRIQGMR